MFEESIDLKISELWKLENVRDEIFASKNYFRAFQNRLPPCDSQTSILQNTKLVLDIIIQDISRWTIKKEVLNHFNRYFNCFSETERVNEINSLISAQIISNTFYLYKLVDLLGAYGDYDFQVLLIKTIITFFKIDKSLTKQLIPESVDLQIKFLNITIENFDCTVRYFLNELNQQSRERKIFSIKCQSITLGSIKYMGINNNLWIDFNLIDEIASWYSTVETSIEDCKFSPEKSNNCNLILLFNTHVDKVTIKRNLCKTLTITFKLNSACVSYAEKDQYLLKNKRTLQIQLDYSPQAEYLIHTILPTLYRTKYVHESCKKKLLRTSNPYLRTPRSNLSNDEIVNISGSCDSMSDVNSYLENISLEEVPIDATNLKNDLDRILMNHDLNTVKTSKSDDLAYTPTETKDPKDRTRIVKNRDLNTAKTSKSDDLAYTPTATKDPKGRMRIVKNRYLNTAKTSKSDDLAYIPTATKDKTRIVTNRDLIKAKTSKPDDFAINTRSKGDPEDDMDFKLKPKRILIFKSENVYKETLAWLANYVPTEKGPSPKKPKDIFKSKKEYEDCVARLIKYIPKQSIDTDKLPVTNSPKIRKTRKNKPVPERTQDEKHKKRKKQDSECSNKTEMSSKKTAFKKDKYKPCSDKNTKKMDPAFPTKVKNHEHKKENKSVSTKGTRKITERNYKISALNVTPKKLNFAEDIKKPKKFFENINKSKRRVYRFDRLLRAYRECDEDVSFHQTLTRHVNPETPPSTVVIEQISEIEIPAIVSHSTPLENINKSKRRDSRFDRLLRAYRECDEDVSFHQTLTRPVNPETLPPTVAIEQISEIEIPAIVSHSTPLENINKSKRRDSGFDRLLRAYRECDEDVSFHQTLTRHEQISEIEIPAKVSHPTPLFIEPEPIENALYAIPECTLNDSKGNQEISQTEENKKVNKPSGGNNIRPLPTANIWANNAIVREDFVGKYIFIIVYNFDISVCESTSYSEMIDINERIEEFNEIGADILICTKGPDINVLEWVNKFKNQELLRNLNIRIINDFDGQFMAKNFQVFLEDVEYEIKMRLIISDKGDVVHKSTFSTLDDINVDTSLKLLRLLQTKLMMR